MSQKAGARDRPLAGVVVVEAASYLAAPFCALMLADLGADVIKIEPPGGEPFRRFGIRRDGLSAAWVSANREKRSVELDLKDSDGRTALLSLLATADVFIENWRFGIAENLRLSAPTIRATNSCLIHLSITGYGPDGPLSRGPVFDGLIQSRTGIAAMETRARHPDLVRSWIVDKTTGVLATQSVLAALFARSSTGEGSDVSVAMLDAMTYFNFPDCLQHRVFVEDEQPYRIPRSPVLSTLDGFVTVVPVSGSQIGRAVEAVGHPEWKAELSVIADPVALIDGFFERMATAVCDQSSARVLASFAAMDVPAAPVMSFDEHLVDDQVLHNALYSEIESPVGRVRAARYPARFNGQMLSPQRPAERVGASTSELLAPRSQGHPPPEPAATASGS